MAKIIKIENHMVIVGLDDGTAVIVCKNDFDFYIHENMYLQAYKYQQNDQDKYIFRMDPKLGKRTYVKKILYGILFFLLGSCGVHEYYARNFKKGLAFLSTTAF